MARPVRQPLDIETGFVEAHAGARTDLPGAAWLGDAREVAINAFSTDGLPHRRLEDYRYFDLRQMLAKSGPLAVASVPDNAQAVDSATQVFSRVDCYLAVLINGRMNSSLSSLSGLPAGVEITSFADAANAGALWLDAAMADAENTKDAVAALNLAYAADGIAIRVPAGVIVDKPIEVRWIYSSDISSHTHAHNVVVVEEGASLTLLETRGDDASAPLFATSATQLVVSDKAQLRHAAVYADNEASVRVARKNVHLGADADYQTLGLSVGAGRARTDEHVLFAGENTKASTRGLALQRGSAVMDNTLFVDHAVPNCQSEETYRYVLDETSRGVFQGSILVRENAQQIDAQMQARALLMSRKAEMDAKPMLEIYADDVQCAHGSAIGEPDQDAIFYLMSRGIDEKTSRALLVAGFLDDVVDGFDGDEIGQALKHLLAARLGAPEMSETSLDEGNA